MEEVKCTNNCAAKMILSWFPGVFCTYVHVFGAKLADFKTLEPQCKNIKFSNMQVE